MTFPDLQIELFALGGVGIRMGSSGLEDVRTLGCGVHGISFPLLPFPLPGPSNLPLDGVAPLTFLGNVSVAVKFLYYSAF